MGGGIFGNTEAVEDNQSGSELKREQEARDWLWDGSELEGRIGALGDLVEDGKSSSNVTHCRAGFPNAGGGGWWRGVRAGGREEGGARGRAGARIGSKENGKTEAGEDLTDMVLWTWDIGTVAGAAVGAGVGISGWTRADMVLWRAGAGDGCWMLKSGVIERFCCCVRGPVKGLVLLGRAGSGSVEKGPGEALRVSCERLREGTGGGGRSKAAANGDGVESEDEDEEEESSACRSGKAEGRWEKDEGRVFEDSLDAGGTGGARREEPLVRDWVVFQDEEDEEEEKSHASVSKGSGFHCASLWIPFSPLVCGRTQQSKCKTGVKKCYNYWSNGT